MVEMRIDNYPQPTPAHIQEDVKSSVPFMPPPPVIDPVNPNPIPVAGEEEAIPVSDETPAGPARTMLRELWKKVIQLLGTDAAEQEDQLAEAKKAEQQMQMIGIRPVLEKPLTHSLKSAQHLLGALKKADQELLVKKVDSINDPMEVEQPTKRNYTDELEGQAEMAPPVKNERVQFLDETKLEKDTIEANKLIVENRAKENANLSDTIVHEGEEKKRLWKQYLDLKAEAELKAKHSKILGWTTLGIGIISGALLIAGIIGAIFTGGASLGAAIAIAGGIAGMSGGGTQIASSVTGYQSNLISGEAFVMKEKQGLKKEIIMNSLQSIETNDNSITQLWSNLAQLLRNMPTDMMRQ